MAGIDPNAVLEGKDLAATKENIKKAIALTDEAIYKTLGQLPSWLDRQMQGLEDTLTFRAFRDTRYRILRSYDGSVQNWEVFKKVAWEAANNGTVDGKPMTLKQATVIIGYMQKLVASTQKSIELVAEYAKGTVVWEAVAKTFGDIGKALANIGNAIGALAQGASSTVSIIGPALPWIVAALVLGPFLLRSFAAYKKGGVTAAAEAAAGELEAGRAAVGRGAKAVWEGGKSLAKRAASGGVLKGAPRRRRAGRA